MLTVQTTHIRRAAVVLTLLAPVSGCSGEDGGEDTSETNLSKAGFKQAAKKLPEPEEVDEADQELPPEQLWSPKDLGFGKKGARKGCFPANEKEYEQVVGRAGDIEIRVKDFTATFHTFTLDSTKNKEDTLDNRKKLVHELIDIELLALVAKRKGYESKQVGELLQKRELANMIKKDLRDQAKSEMSEEAYRKYYNTHSKKYMIHPDQRKVVQIIVKGKKNAAKLIKQVKDEKIEIKEFMKLARAHSIDDDLDKTSGKTDWFSNEGIGAKGNVIPMNVAQEAFKLKKKGSVSKQPLPSSKGWHVVMLLNTRPEKWIPYGKVRGSIVAHFVSERQKVLIDKLLDSLKRNHPVSVSLAILEKISPVPCM